jgi:glycosyltransferase involved in cell wall biosynthesis
MPRQTVAAVIPVKNVARIIRGTLESLRFCDEIIVIDMSSTDGTRAVCESFPNVRFFERADYIYGNFNFGVEQAKSAWIIRLDSDERLSPALQREIVALLEVGPSSDVYEAPFTSYFLGHPIRHGAAWEQRTRKTLFRRGTLRYKVQSEHEDLTPAGRPVTVGQLRGRYHHFSTPDIATFIRKLNDYSEWDFERVRIPQRVKVLPPWRLMLSIPHYFVHQYISGRGYRDGYAGFALCALNAVYRLVHELKAWECHHGLRLRHERVREKYDAALRESGSGQQ